MGSEISVAMGAGRGCQPGHREQQYLFIIFC